MEPKSIDRIFWEAAQLASTDERDAYLDRACASDIELRRRVQQLLEARSKAEGFLEARLPSLVATAGERLVSEGPGTVIGSYRLLEQIGEGGFGVVFMAEQQRPVRRKVALKVLKPGMDTRQVIARFEAERQALALMDHPNIARVFDGGETASGGPYFVMELIKGIPITHYCDESQLNPTERLELFVSVCQAVQHAHQKGVIHRDLKPSNVLVTLHDGSPVVKVIDFGIAKATGQQLTDKTLFTNFAQLIGTPLYMSPEQAALSGLDVDTRSDIYSLGVLLYELLTGTTPFDKDRFQEAGYDEIRRIIREEEPPRPSTRISTLGEAATALSTRRKSDPRRLSQLFRGEIDWIVMQCLEKDRNRRYQTANSLAMDVQRYLRDEPVLACPPSAGYRFRKFARRHRAGLLAASLAALALVAGAGVCAWLAVWATRAEALAKTRLQSEQSARAAESKRRDQARSALDANTSLLMEDILARQQTLSEVHKNYLRRALDAYLEFAADTPDDEASRYGVARALSNVALIRNRLSPSLELLDSYQAAIEKYALLVADFPANAKYRSELADAQTRLGVAAHDRGKLDDAVAAFTDSLAVGERLIAEYPAIPEYRRSQAECHFGLANLHASQGRTQVALTALQQAISLLAPLVAKNPKDRKSTRTLARCQLVTSAVSEQRGDSALAIDASRKAIALLIPLVNSEPDREDRMILAHAYNSLANRLSGKGRPEEIEKAYREAVAAFRGLVEEFPGVAKFRSDLAICLANWANFLQNAKRLPEAEESAREAHRLVKRLADEYPAIMEYRTTLAGVQSNRGNMMRMMRNFRDAEACLNDALTIRRGLVASPHAAPALHNSLAVTLGLLGELLRDQHQYLASCDPLKEALPHHEVALTAAPRNPYYLGPYRDNRHNMAASLIELGDYAAAAIATNQFLQTRLDPPKDSYVAARLLAQCANLAGRDGKLAQGRRTQESERFANEAMELLLEAIAKGFKDADQLRKDDAFDVLRSRQDFQELLGQLKTEPSPHRK